MTKEWVMLPNAVRGRLVGESFGKKLAQGMAEVGLPLLYQFTASTERDTYHTSVLYAQETTFFFYLPDHAFIVQLALSEKFDPEGRRDTWWTGAVYVELDTTSIIEYEVQSICKYHDLPLEEPYMDEWCEPFGHVLYNMDERLQPFAMTGGSRTEDYEESTGWTLRCDDGLTIEQLVAFADGLRTHFGPFLLPKFPRNFNAFHFSPSEIAWPDVRKRFWQSFPLRLLKDIVRGEISRRPRR